MTLIAILALPLLAALLSSIRPFRLYVSAVTIMSTSACFALAVYVSAQVIEHGRFVALPGWFEADGLSALMLVLVSFVVALAAIFAHGYMQHGHDEGRLWWFYGNYNLLAFALLAVPSLAEPNLV
ncbi:MAG: hypothetical protein WBW85_02460, partial [Terriglobales bacterium]